VLMELTKLRYHLPPVLEPMVYHVKDSSMQFPSLLGSYRLNVERRTASRFFLQDIRRMIHSSMGGSLLSLY